MSTDFTATNKSLESAIAAAQSPQQVAELLRLHQEKSGTPQWDNRGTYWPQTLPEAKAPVQESAAEPSGTGKCVRVFYPGGNAKFEIYGASESELDAQEQKIRSLYGR